MLGAECLQELQWLLLLFIMMFCLSVLFFFSSEGLLWLRPQPRCEGMHSCV